jgi:hypothetical protein
MNPGRADGEQERERPEEKKDGFEEANHGGIRNERRALGKPGRLRPSAQRKERG